ncbi:MAG: glucose-6-phosphate dehydrogenase assembly protein OpcA [Candidatus Dormibacteraceae bacterium]
MAPAVSATTVAEPTVVWHGESTSMRDVLAALDAIRARFAREEAGDAEHPHPRNCVMTLVAVASGEAEERRAQRACRLIAAEHPAQLIVIRDQAELRGGGIEASISADTQRTESCSAQSELVTLRVRGATGEHLAALVDPLLESGVPTFLWWVGTPPFGKPELADALHICDALVVDSARFDSPYRSFLGLAELFRSRHHKMGVADFQWSRLRQWRESVAQFFTPPERWSFLSGISEVGIEYAGEGRGNRIAAALLNGWLASTLGWKLQRAASGGGGGVAAHYAADGWRPVEVAFRSVPKARLTSGEVAAIRVAGAAGGATFRLSVQRDPERPRAIKPQTAYRSIHRPGGEDDAGWELAQRSAEWHRDVLHENRDAMHHTFTGDPPGESMPKHPVVSIRERRGDDSSQVLLTLIEIRGGDTLRHVQRIEPDDEAALLLDLLSSGTHDPVFVRSLAAASDLMRSV